MRNGSPPLVVRLFILSDAGLSSETAIVTDHSESRSAGEFGNPAMLPILILRSNRKQKLIAESVRKLDALHRPSSGGPRCYAPTGIESSEDDEIDLL